MRSFHHEVRIFFEVSVIVGSLFGRFLVGVSPDELCGMMSSPIMPVYL
jgi:hypothetical protein